MPSDLHTNWPLGGAGGRCVVLLLLAGCGGRVGCGRLVLLTTGTRGRLVLVVLLGRAGRPSSSTSMPGVVAGATVVGRLVVLTLNPVLVVEPAGRAVVVVGLGLTWPPGPTLESITRLIVFNSGYFSSWHLPEKSSVSMLHIIIPPKPIDFAYWLFNAKLCMSS